MNEQELKKDLYKTVGSWVGIPIQDSTTFFEDTQMDGLDCWSFIDQVAERYNVDFSAYNWELYHMADADVTNILKHLTGNSSTQKNSTRKHLLPSIYTRLSSEGNGSKLNKAQKQAANCSLFI